MNLFLEDVFNATESNCNYVFMFGNPIDNRRPKYRIWKKMHDEGRLKCKCCGSPVHRVKLVPCKGAGSIHKPTEKIKYTFKLYSKDGGEMTFDHWIPKSFLKKRSLHWNCQNNLVLMCKKCNKFKADMVPYNWIQQYVKMY